jgi:hypothetical protein
LFVAAGADDLLPPSHAERLGAIAREEDEVDTIDVVTIERMDGNLAVVGAPRPAMSQDLLVAVTTWLSNVLAR